MKTQALLLIVVALVSVLAGGCAAPKAAVPATQAPAPTAQNTVAAPTLNIMTPIPPTVVPGAIDSGVTIRFSAGDKCTLEGPKSIRAGYNNIHWIVECKEHDRFALAYVTLDPGKTIEDLRALPPEQTDAPSFARWDGITHELEPGGSTTISILAVTGPVYFVCFYREPPRHFGSVGPLEVITN